MKKVFALNMVMALLVGVLAGWAGAPLSSTAPVEGTTTVSGGRTIAFATSTLNNPFMVTIGDTLKEIAAEKGDTLIELDPQYDQATQISQIEDAVTQGVDAIFMIHVSADGVRSALEKAHEAGVPVFGIDDPLVDTDLIVANIYSDNHYAGVVCGEALLADFPDGAKIAIIDSPTMVGPVNRVEGFMEALENDIDKFDTVSQQDGKATLTDAQVIAENVIQANPDIEAFFCINDPNALGTIAALRAAGLNGTVKVYSVDGSPDAKAELESGDLRITAAQSPINLAKITYETFEKYLAGEEVERDILVPTFGITAENVEEYGVDGWQ